MEALNPKSVLATAAIVLLALSFAPITGAATGSHICNTPNINLDGLQLNPSNPNAAIPFTVDLTGTTVLTKGNLVQGSLTGTYNAIAMSGGYNYNTATGKMLAKITGGGMEIDLAFITSGAPAGFTFQGTIHIPGVQPQMLVNIAGTGLTCPS